MARLLHGLGMLSARRPLVMIGVWVLLGVLVFGAVAMFGSQTNNDLSSARITTAAALIMASVFASFILNGDPTIKQFGVGLATAVLLAGLLVVTLGPAEVVLFGRAAWWLPAWLDKILPHISVEGETMPSTEEPTPDVEQEDDGPKHAAEPEPV